MGKRAFPFDAHVGADPADGGGSEGGGQLHESDVSADETDGEDGASECDGIGGCWFEREPDEQFD